MIGAFSNHLWQSTLFALAAALAAIACRRNHAHIRYWLWLSASLKFLLPFSLLMSLGRHLEWGPPAQKIAAPSIRLALVAISQPFPSIWTPPLPAQSTQDWAAIALLGVWGCGLAGVALIRFRGWLRIRAAVRASTRLDVPASIEVRCSPGLLEPGVIGLFRPILLVPSDILERLTPGQWEAVLAHESCHVRRRDNLTAAMHMVVEAIFWFYPPVWWIGARLVEEREQACDEAVLSQGSEPHEYAEGILNVCKGYLESPLRCVTGVTGSDLRKRVHAILAGRIADELHFAKKIALAAAGIAAIAVPVIVGTLNAPSVRAQSQPQAAPPYVTTARRIHQIDGLGAVTAYTVTVKSRVDGQLMSVNFKEGDRVQAGQALATIDPRPYQAQVAQAEGQLARDQAALADFKLTNNEHSRYKPDLDLRVAQFEGSIKTDQAKVDEAKLQLAYTQIASPISGVAGLRQVDPGNIVHAMGDTIVIINQLQPIAVIFTVAEDRLPEVQARLRAAASLPVEAWDRTMADRIATSRLTAVDNQIDVTTGAVKLKAMFDNGDGALFPGQFVNVRLLLNAQ
jgi:RND family efflux transporter MFP subunit